MCAELYFNSQLDVETYYRVAARLVDDNASSLMS